MWSKELDSSDSWDWVKGEWYRKSSMVDETTPEFKEKMKKIYSRTAGRADSAGMVILMHDTHNTTLRILPDLIKGLKAKGYSFATMEDYVIWRYSRSSSELMKGIK
jgi:peptidoglycan/xylan/chitin deacetylase (PgdA/CDA1 family)